MRTIAILLLVVLLAACTVGIMSVVNTVDVTGTAGMTVGERFLVAIRDAVNPDPVVADEAQLNAALDQIEELAAQIEELRATQPVSGTVAVDSPEIVALEEALAEAQAELTELQAQETPEPVAPTTTPEADVEAPVAEELPAGPMPFLVDAGNRQFVTAEMLVGQVGQFDLAGGSPGPEIQPNCTYWLPPGSGPISSVESNANAFTQVDSEGYSQINIVGWLDYFDMTSGWIFLDGVDFELIDVSPSARSVSEGNVVFDFMAGTAYQPGGQTATTLAELRSNVEISLTASVGVPLVEFVHATTLQVSPEVANTYDGGQLVLWTGDFSGIIRFRDGSVHLLEDDRFAQAEITNFMALRDAAHACRRTFDVNLFFGGQAKNLVPQFESLIEVTSAVYVPDALATPAPVPTVNPYP